MLILGWMSLATRVDSAPVVSRISSPSCHGLSALMSKFGCLSMGERSSHGTEGRKHTEDCRYQPEAHQIYL